MADINIQEESGLVELTWHGQLAPGLVVAFYCEEFAVMRKGCPQLQHDCPCLMTKAPKARSRPLGAGGPVGEYSVRDPNQEPGLSRQQFTLVLVETTMYCEAHDEKGERGRVSSWAL